MNKKDLKVIRPLKDDHSYLNNIKIEFEKYDYDLRQGKIHAFIEGKIPTGKFNKTGEKPLAITFTLREALDFAGYYITEYKTFEKDLWYLATKAVYIKLPEKIIIKTGWISNNINTSARKGTKGIITVRINKSLMDYYYTTENFTKYKTEYVKNFNHKYSKPIYEYFKMKKTRDRVTTYEDDLNFFYKKLDLSDRFKKDFSAFKEKILNPALEDINKYTDLKISYGSKTKGVDILEFIILTKEESWYTE